MKKINTKYILLLVALNSGQLHAADGCPPPPLASEQAQAYVDNVNNILSDPQMIRTAKESGANQSLDDCISGLNGFGLSILGGMLPSIDICQMLTSYMDSAVGSVTSQMTLPLPAGMGTVSGGFNDSGTVSATGSALGSTASTSVPTSSIITY